MFHLRWVYFSTLTRVAAIGMCLGLVIEASPPAQAADKKTEAAASSQAEPAESPIDPAAVQALSEMSAFLQAQSTFKLDTQTSLDVVTHDDQKIQLVGTATYKVRKPDAFVVDVVSSSWNRRYIYFGKQFTVHAPQMGYYATVQAPETIQATIADISDRFGISVPLDDLFRWSSPEGERAEDLESAFLVGAEVLDGVKTDHYAFREGLIDWQIWIQQGEQPLPLKVVIVDRSDETHPSYIARLAWSLNPPLRDADFAFQPAKDDKRIRIQETLEGDAP